MGKWLNKLIENKHSICCTEQFTNGIFKMLKGFTSMEIDKTKQIWFREES